jgi:tetratricopeptide (TPR) repeat protein
MDTDPRIRNLLLRWEQLRRRGSPPTLDELCAGCPELRDVVERRIGDPEPPLASLSPPTEATTTTAKLQTELSLPTEAGRFRLLGEIARGGMGAVLRAYDPAIGRDVALKVILPEHQNDPGVLRCFLFEARLAGQLEHPGLAPVYDLGTLPDGRPFFVMRLIQGRTLAALLQERPTLAALKPADERANRQAAARPQHDLPHFLRYFEAVAQTVGYAHSRGVVHRDLKPANVMVGAFGEVQVMDWGLAKLLRDRSEVASAERAAREGVESQDGSIVGTPGYMAPEQAKGRRDQIDARSDVFGLGAILCEILTGQPPFLGAQRQDVLLQTVAGDLSESFARLDRCGADAELVRLAKACLMPMREERPADGGVVAKAMSAYLAGVQQRLRQAELGEARAEARAEGERKRRRLAVAAYRQAIKLRPDDAKAHYNLGHALRKQKRLDEAVAALRQAVKLRPDYAKAHNNLGNALRKQKAFDEAMAAYRQAIALQPDYALAHNNLGTVLYEQKKLDESIAAFHQAIAIRPDLAEAHNNLGNALRKKKALDEAAAAYREAITLQPKFAEPHLNLGLALIQQARFKEALAALKKGRKLLRERDSRRQSVQQLIDSCQRDLELETRLPAILEGTDKPTGAAERIQLARLCMLKNLSTAAARFSVEAFTADPKIAESVSSGARYHAACCAARACCGECADAGKLDKEERRRWRQQALDWLWADLVWWTRVFDSVNTSARAGVGKKMQEWQIDPDLSVVRDSDALNALPTDERSAWRRLWDEVDALLRRSQAPR